MTVRALLLLLVACPAFAQMPPCVDRSPLALTYTTVPDGIPEPLKAMDPAARSCPTVIEVNAVGAAVAFWCEPKTRSVPWYPSLYAVRWSAVTAPMLADFALLSTPGDTAMKIATMQTKYQTVNILDMCDVYGPALDRINAAMPPPLPPPPAWAVKANGASVVRPAYTVVAGKIIGPAGQASVGQACDITQPVLLSGADRWAVFGPAFTPTVLTLCAKQ